MELLSVVNRWKVVIVILGPTFHGKSTLSLCLKKHFKERLTMFIAGDYLKKEVDSGSPLGRRLDKVMSRGGLLKDSLVREVMVKKLYELVPSEILLLEGYPRSTESLKHVYKSLSSIKGKMLIFEIDRIPDEELIRRVKLDRFMCVKCKSATFLNERCALCGNEEQIPRKEVELSLALSMVKDQSKIFNTNLWNRFSSRYKVTRLTSLNLEENLKNIIEKV